MAAKIRCPYFEINDQERAYHDKEWGTPCRNDRKLFPREPDFKFLGTVTIYAFMQSVGLVNDHARFCFRYKELTR